jgi:cellulose synthase (UDP-forming)
MRLGNWKLRLAALVLVLATAWYLPWLLQNLNWRAPWLSIPFAMASIMTAVLTLTTVINHWQYSDSPRAHLVTPGQEPEVLVIIPTYGEPPAMVYETARSVLEQDYPMDQIRLVISDDSHRPEMRTMAAFLQEAYPRASVRYHDPPHRGDPHRRGEAKAGNLNAVFDAIDLFAVQPQFVETRDADDLVGDATFLRQTIGQLLAHPRAAFVQTIKEAVVSTGDPFGNQELLFYRRAMLARNAANAVFPCGSGLVWRREALDEIDGFPTWNLVEDLQSGVEALRRGWKGIYLPIVGAMGQTAPEDIPNAIKQRGTWALDTMRLSFWGNKRGLNLRQRLQFAELGFFYIFSLAVLVFALTPIIALLFDIYPIITTHAEYAVRFWVYAFAVELLLVSLAGRLAYEELWRARQTWLGMAPVYALATLLALLYGPKRKPHYRVTRKEHVYGWYWREVLPQIAITLALVMAALYHIATRPLLAEADLGSLFWAAFLVLGFSRVVRNSWHGVAWRQSAGRRSGKSAGNSV